MSSMRVARAVSEGNRRGVHTPSRQGPQKLESVLSNICLLGRVSKYLHFLTLRAFIFLLSRAPDGD